MEIDCSVVLVTLFLFVGTMRKLLQTTRSRVGRYFTWYWLSGAEFQHRESALLTH